MPRSIRMSARCGVVWSEKRLILKNGISTACLYPQLLEESLEMIGELKAGYTEVFFSTLSEIGMDYVKMLRKKAERLSLDIVSVHPFTSGHEPLYFFSRYERRFNDSRDLYKRMYKAAAVLGAKYFVFHGDRKQPSVSKERYFEIFDILSRDAGEFGIKLLQENVAGCTSNTPQFCRLMREQLPEAGFVLDIKQVIRSGFTVDDMLDAMGSSVCHVHISDSTPSNDCLPAGEGDYDFNMLVNRLAGYGYDGALMLELYRETFSSLSQLKRSWEYIQDIIDKTSKEVDE